MPNYRIGVREVNSWHFLVEAETLEDALDAVQEQLDEDHSSLVDDLSRMDLDDGRYETDGAEQVDDQWTPDYFATYNGLMSFADHQSMLDEGVAAG